MMMKLKSMSKDKSIIQERLVGLYLRLNGYFQTGYIPHSSKLGQIGTDYDRFAIRFPKHSQPEREIKNCPFLKIPYNTIDMILAEVKNSKLEFNKTIKSGGSRAFENWEQLLRWSGMFDINEIDDLVPILISIVDQDGKKDRDDFNYATHKNNFGVVTIRPILFSFESQRNETDSKIWINGEDLISFIWDCLCPSKMRLDCSTSYPIMAWGFEYSDIVKFFKDRHKKKLDRPTTMDLYSAFKV